VVPRYGSLAEGLAASIAAETHATRDVEA